MGSENLKTMSGDSLSDTDIAAIQQRFTELRRQEYQLTQKIAELETEGSEHVLVLNTISKMDPARKCFHLVGGVLVQKTVGEVIPDVGYSRDKMATIVEQLQKTLASKTAELNDLQKRFGASAGSVSAKGDGDSGGERAAVSKGVLVG